MNRAQTIDHYTSKILAGELEIDAIRKELEAQGVEDDEIRDIVRIVDSDVQRKALTKSGKSASNELMWMGLVLMVIGAGVTIGTYTGFIYMGNSFLIVYGPFFAGLSLFLTGLAKKSK